MQLFQPQSPRKQSAAAGRHSLRLSCLGSWAIVIAAVGLGVGSPAALEIARAQGDSNGASASDSLYGGLKPFSLARSGSSFAYPFIQERFVASTARPGEHSCNQDSSGPQTERNARRLQNNGYTNDETREYLAAIHALQNTLRGECERLHTTSNLDEALSIGRARDQLRVKAMSLEDGIFHGGPKSESSLQALIALAGRHKTIP